MPTSAFTRFNALSEHLAKKTHDLHADTLKVYLSNAAPDVAADVVKGDLAEITPGNGYPAGGSDLQNAVSRAGAVSSVTASDVTFTASGGPVGPFRYAVVYNDDATTPADALVGYWDYGAAGVTLQDGEPFLIDVGASILTITS